MRSYFRIISAALLAASALSAGAAEPLDAWHYGTLRLSPHRCEATFIFDAGRSVFREVRVQAVAKDRQGHVLGRFALAPTDMGVDRTNRFATATWTDAQACNPEVVVVFKTATAMVDGMAVDLLATQQLRLRRYEPFELRLPQSRERP